MQNTKYKIQRLYITFLIVVGVLLCVFTHSNVAAYYEATYADSAHGSTSCGVKCSDTTYTKGDCVNCHDPSGPDACVNELMLFAPMNPTSQTDNFCFQCHKGSGSVQVGGVTNNDYGSTFGGGPPNSTNIKDAFNFGPPNQASTAGSSHNLKKLRNGWMVTAGGDWVTTDTNACVVCHDPHFSQKNHDPYPDSPPYKTAIRRPDAPSSSINRPRNLWGDEANSDAGAELLSEGTTGYQAPKRVGGNYEPAGQTSPTDGSNLTGFNRFCWTCHRFSIPNAETDADPLTLGGRNLRAINWSNSGDCHGNRAESPDEYIGDPPCTYGSLKPPYDDPDKNYVLSCTDCHEPHGSPNVFLLRTVVNGKDISPYIQTWSGMESRGMYEFCTACHNVNGACGPHWWGEDPSNFGCGYCHFHGAPGGGQEF